MVSEARPLVTVITVTYNAKLVIDATLNSVVSQAGANFEWLVIDGASRDDTLLRIKQFSSGDFAVRWISEPDEGLYDAMNKGIALAQGRYLIFMNAGDAFADGRVLADFEEYIDRLGSSPAMIYGHTLVVFDDGKKFLRKVRPLNYIWHGQPTIHQSVFFNRDKHLESVYPYKKCPVSSDYAAIAKIQKENAGGVSVWDRTVSIFNNDPKSFGNRQLKQRVIDAWVTQRDILHSSLILRVISAARRCAVNIFYNFR